MSDAVHLPSQLMYACKRLEGFSKNMFRFYPSQTDNIQPEGTITLTLPSGNPCLDTLKLYGDIRLDRRMAFAKNIESFFSKIELQINGNTVIPPCVEENFLQNIKLNWLANDATVRRFPQLSGSYVQTDIYPVDNTGASQIAAPTQESHYNVQHFCLTNWGSVIDSIQPRTLNTMILGDVKIVLTLAPAWVNILRGLTVNNVITPNPTGIQPYSMKNLYATVEKYNLTDVGYNAKINGELSSGTTLKLPYTKYTFFQGPVGDTNRTLQAYANTRCFTHVIAGFRLQGYNTGALDSATGQTGAFTSVMNDLGTSVVNFNGTQNPTYPITPFEIYNTNLDSLQLTKETSGTHVNPKINSLATFCGGYGVHIQTFDFPMQDKDRHLSGLSTLGNQVPINWTTTSATTPNAGLSSLGSTYIPFLYCAQKSELLVRNGRVLESVW